MLFRWLLLCLVLAPSALAQETCTYSTWAWRSEAQRAENFETIEKPYAVLEVTERDPLTGCTVCEEDQQEISLPGLAPFFMCKAVADDVERALMNAMEGGFEIRTVTGYRVGKTRGALDADGLRTKFSNHSFGMAIDINAERNGLYDQCVEFSSRCRLLRGGGWRPGASGAITPGTPLYQELRAIGFKWGGELEGRQKDFMHFSPSGD